MESALAVPLPVTRARLLRLLRALCMPGVLLAMLLLAVQTPARGDDETSRYFAELRRRHLFRVAEAFCLHQLQLDTISDERRVELTLELSRTLVDHARNVRGAEQADLWKRAAQTIDDVLATIRDGRLRAPMEFQRALVPASRGIFLAWEAEFSPQDSMLRKETLDALDEAVLRFRRIDDAPEKRTRPVGAQTSPRDGSPARTERELLRNETQLQLASALLTRARAAAKDAASREADLVQAEAALKPLVTAPRLETRARARLHLAERSRLRGDFADAHRQLDAAIAEPPPTDVYDRLVAQKVLLLLDEKKSADAAEVLVVYRRNRGILPEELGLLKVQATVAMAKVAREGGEKDLAGQLLQQAEKHVMLAEHDAGGFWADRSRRLLRLAREDQALGGELAALLRTAEGLFADGKMEAAIDAYGQAVSSAQQSGNDEMAMELGFTHASLVLRAGRAAEAAEEFRRLAERYPHSPRAAGAHLMWAYGLGRVFDVDQTEMRQKSYADALAAHLEKFAVAPTAVDAKWMSARLEEGRENFQRALELYLQVPFDHERGAESQAGVARCYEVLLDNRRKSKQSVASLEESAVKQLDVFVTAFPPAPGPLSLTQAEVALRLARMRLNQSPPAHEAADRLLERIVAGQGEARRVEDPSEQQTWESIVNAASELRVISLAGRGHFADAGRLVSNLAKFSTTELLGILGGLSQLLPASDPLLRSELGRLQLKAAQLLSDRRSAMSEGELERLYFYRAQAYVSLGEEHRAIELYEELLAKAPRDKRLLEQAARSLKICATMKCLEKSKGLWQRLESMERPGTAVWLVARYNVAHCCFQLNQLEECAALLRITRILYPEMGGPELKARFDEVEHQLKTAR